MGLKPQGRPGDVFQDPSLNAGVNGAGVIREIIWMVFLRRKWLDPSFLGMTGEKRLVYAIFPGREAVGGFVSAHDTGL